MKFLYSTHLLTVQYLYRYKEPGESIKYDDLLCDIETPDFTFGMATEDKEDSIMGEILVHEDEICQDGDELCHILQRPEKDEE